jgi:hypothetical protein
MEPIVPPLAPSLWVEVRLTHIDGRWIASADTPDGPSLLGQSAADCDASRGGTAKQLRTVGLGRGDPAD